MLEDPFLRETLGPVAALAGAGRDAAATAPLPLQHRSSLRLSRSESLTRGGPGRFTRPHAREAGDDEEPVRAPLHAHALPRRP